MSGRKQWKETAEEIRLNKYLAQAGICSRRDADKLIETGAVSVNDKIAAPGTKITPDDKVCVRGKLIGGRQDTAVLAYYKPLGVICSERDKHADRLLTDELHFPVRVTYAGRLDKDSEGLLIMTNDGDLIEQMMRGANCHEKEYQVRVDKPVSDNFLKGMSEGVYLEDLDITTRKCKVRRTGRYTFSMILTQGVNRQIRRMTESFGYRVRALRRIRVLNITLEGLKPGEYRVLQGEELEKLYRECKGKTMRKIDICEENA